MSLFDPAGAFGKDTWLPSMYDQLENTPGLFYNMLEEIEPVRIEGRNTYFKVEVGDSLGQGVTAEGGDFPDPFDPEYDEARLTMSRLSHTAQLTFDEWEMLNSEPAAAVPIVERKLFKAVQKMTREIARISMMDGTSILARCTDSADGLVVTLETDDGDAGSANQYDRDRRNWLAPGRARIDFVDATTGVAITNGTDRTIVDFDGTDLTVDTAGGNVNTEADTVIVWHGSVRSVGGAFTSDEFPGINAILDTSRDYLGIDSSDAGKTWWDPTVVGNSGTNRMISLDLLLTLYNRMSLTADDGMAPTADSGYSLFSNLGVSAAAIEYLAPGIRYIDPTPGETPSFGWRRVDGLGIPWYTDIHYPHNVLDILHRPSLRKVKPKRTMQEILDFVTTGSGSMWHLKNAANSQGHAAAVLAYLTGLIGLMTTKPAAHGRLDDLRELGV